MMTQQNKSRDDDSAQGVKIELDDAKSRLDNIENALTNPHRIGTLIADAVRESVELRNQLTITTLEFLDDYNNRKALEKIIVKIDRKWWNSAWKRGLGVVGAIALVILGAFLQAWFSRIK